MRPTVRRLALVAALAVVPTREQTCSGPEHRRLDFLVGNWLVRERSGRAVGTATIAWEYGGCVLIERRSGVGAAGDALGVWGYRTSEGRWHRDFLEPSGRLLTLDGRADGGRVVLTGRDYPTDGGPRLHRLSWEPTADGAVEERWDTSTDGGGTWQARAHGVLRRYGE